MSTTRTAPMCPAGLHEMTPENMIVRQYKTKPTARDCRACENDRNREHMARAREAKAESRNTQPRRFDYSDQPWYDDYNAGLARANARLEERRARMLPELDGMEEVRRKGNTVVRIDYSELYLAQYPHT